MREEIGIQKTGVRQSGSLFLAALLSIIENPECDESGTGSDESGSVLTKYS
jgi:hypothetical protein